MNSMENAMKRVNPMEQVVLGLLLIGAFALAPQVTSASPETALHGNRTKHNATATSKVRDLEAKAFGAAVTRPIRRTMVAQVVRPRAHVARPGNETLGTAMGAFLVPVQSRGGRDETTQEDTKVKEEASVHDGPRLELGRMETPRPGDYLAIQVTYTGLRNKPGILARTTTTLRRGARVLVLDTKTAWALVQFGPHVGWVRTEALLPYESPALSKCKFVINPEDRNTLLPSEDSACMGGKG